MSTSIKEIFIRNRKAKSATASIRSTAKTSLEQQKEWIPSMLKKTRALPLASVCFLLVVLLEVLDLLVAKNHGIPINESGAVFVIRYLPTFCVVSLGFIWKSIIAEVKKLTPWSVMSDKWAMAEDSVFVNYVNSLEISSVFSSVKRRHWAAFVVLLVGFFSGAAVTAANALTYTELSSTTQTNVTMTRLSRFDFTGALVLSNGTLAIPEDHTGSQPYAAVAAERLSGGQSAAYTSDLYAFDNFTTVSKPSLANATLQANVSAFTADWICHRLNYSANYIDPEAYRWQLVASPSSNPDAQCSHNITQTFSSTSIWTELAWLNLTSCTNDSKDLRLLATLMVPTAEDMWSTPDAAKAIGLMCAPQFSIVDALVGIDASSGRVTSYATNYSSPEVVDIATSLEAIYLYLNNPLDARFNVLRLPSNVPSQQFKADLGAVDDASTDFLYYFSSDPFFMSMTGARLTNLSQTYMDDQDLFENEVKMLATQIMVQVVSSFARKDDSTMINGLMSLNQSRLLVRQSALRILQSILFVMGVASVLQSTLLRPRTSLNQDPGPIASTAIVLARSGHSVEREFKGQDVTSDNEMRRSLTPIRWKLGRDKSGTGTTIEIDSVISSTQHSTPSRRTKRHTGWRPFALRTDAKSVVIVAFCAVIVTLAVLQSHSSTRNGLCQYNTKNSNLYDFFPTFILVLLSAFCSGIDSAIRSMLSYRSLWKASKKKPLLSNFQDGPSLHALLRSPRRASSGFGLALVASALATLIFPWIKIVAAGLYDTVISSTSEPVLLYVDSSLVDDGQYINYANGIGDPRNYAERASQFAEWIMTPSFNIAERSGALDNLVFSNITGWSPIITTNSSAGYEIEARVSALAVDVACEAIPSAEFDVLALWSTACSNKTFFDFRCNSKHCMEVLNVTENDQKYSGINFMGNDPDIGTPECFNETLKNYAGACYWEPYDVDDAFVVFLADYSSVMQPFHNYTPVNTNSSTLVKPSMFNVSLPTFRAVSCFKNITTVDVNVTFTQPTSLSLGGGLMTLPWTPSSYERDSITYGARLTDTSMLTQMIPNGEATLLASDQIGLSAMLAMLNSTSLWPTTGSSSSFFELLAAYAEYEMNNLTALLDADQLAAASEVMYTAVVSEMLTDMRPYALDIANATSNKTITGTMRRYQVRIGQDLQTTIILEVLLIVVLCCLLWIIFRFPSSSILPKEPDSIAARMSFLAGSELVQRLREQDVSSAKETDIWQEKAGLGWWRVHSACGEDTAKQWRWGIDVGPGMVPQDWNRPPCEESIELMRMEGTLLPASDDRSHGSAYAHSPGPYEQVDQADFEEDPGSGSRREHVEQGDTSTLLTDERPNTPQHSWDLPWHTTPQLPPVSPVSSLSSVTASHHNSDTP